MRRKFTLAATILMICAGAIAGCGPKHEKTGDSTILHANSRLEINVRSHLDSDPEISSAQLSISADSDKQQVLLRGTVKSEALRQRAIDLARRARSGLVVIDKLKVEPEPGKPKRMPGRSRIQNADNSPEKESATDIIYSS